MTEEYSDRLAAFERHRGYRVAYFWWYIETGVSPWIVQGKGVRVRVNHPIWIPRKPVSPTYTVNPAGVLSPFKTAAYAPPGFSPLPGPIYSSRYGWFYRPAMKLRKCKLRRRLERLCSVLPISP